MSQENKFSHLQHDTEKDSRHCPCPLPTSRPIFDNHNILALSPPTTVSFRGRSFIPPTSQFARTVVMGNEASSLEEPPRYLGQPLHISSSSRHQTCSNQSRPASNLTVLLSQVDHQQLPLRNTQNPNDGGNGSAQCPADEADSASGPSISLGSSAPSNIHSTRRQQILPTAVHAMSGSAPSNVVLARQNVSDVVSTVVVSTPRSDLVRRCLSSKELGTLAPPSGSPYACMLHKKEQLETSMRQRLKTMRESLASDAKTLGDFSDDSSGASYRLRERSNEMRNRRRAQHNQAVVEDLCTVVADLFIAESKLLKPLNYGVPDAPSSSFYGREQVLRSIRSFISTLPTRYALGADTPSEVLLHMRLMAAARSDKTKAVVHIHNLSDDSNWSRNITALGHANLKTVRLVTISCSDATGLLEYITKTLATNGSRVLDADVMLSTDGIVLDRFVVEMNGRLRLDMLANMIEAFLMERRVESGTTDKPQDTRSHLTKDDAGPNQHTSGPLYYKMNETPKAARDYRDEIVTAVPLIEVLGSSKSTANLLSYSSVMPSIRRLNSTTSTSSNPPISLSSIKDPIQVQIVDSTNSVANDAETQVPNTRRRRQLINRRGSSNLDEFEAEQTALDYVTITNTGIGLDSEIRNVPIIPFDELMLIETLGTGRVSTIYRAAWQRAGAAPFMSASVQMVALKVAMINHITGDTSHVDELRREADIAARLSHFNVCDLVGVAADHDCFCLAYDFCEGGSLLSLLSDTRRYYEYLPIALDIANGMAYLHSRNVIHRDLKPSNILLTRDHRAKISDFGMSVADAGQDLTAETGTYRYMAPEVIRHESYSSNADVYSFGICLWQLITREVPFATMTPIQAAYSVAEGQRPPIPPTAPRRLQDIIMACWDHDSHRRPSFTYIAMALADYAKMAFSPANVGALTLQIANEMLATVEGNSNVNVDFSTSVALDPSFLDDQWTVSANDSYHNHNIGLDIE